MTLELATFSGARLSRVIDRSGTVVPEHAHDWPVLCLFVMGGYRNRTTLGERDIQGPSAILYQAGAFHANRVGQRGFEQIELEFDPRWAPAACSGRPPVSRWLSGPAAAAAARLTDLCLSRPGEAGLRSGLDAFLGAVHGHVDRAGPDWLADVDRMVEPGSTGTLETLGRRLGRHPAWLSAEFARNRGEGIARSRIRRRVEEAARLLRETDLPLAAIAQDAGFFDQSHMTRSMRAILGATPGRARADRASMRAPSTP